MAGLKPTERDPLSSAERFARQENSYRFPYHWLPAFDDDVVTPSRSIAWAFRYHDRILQLTDIIRSAGAREVLDVGCGDGRIAFEIRARTSAAVTGIDLAPQAIELARAMCYERDGIRFEVGRVEDLPKSRQFDAIIFTEVLEHVPDDDIRPLITSIAAHLAPDGVLAITVPTTNTPTDKKHERHYTKELLALHLAPEFVVERHWYRHRVGRSSRWFERFVANRAVSITSRRLLRLLTRTYERRLAPASEATGTNIVAVARRPR